MATRRATVTWSPDQYERFRAERSAPFFDLLDLLDAVYASGRLTFPFEGILLFGY